MRLSSIVFMYLILMQVPSILHSQGQRQVGSSVECIDREGVSAVSWGVSKCRASALRIINKDLNHKYKKLTSVISEKNRLYIVDDERKWLIERDRKCGLGANENPIANAQAECLISLTKLRIKWIDDKMLQFSAPKDNLSR